MGVLDFGNPTSNDSPGDTPPSGLACEVCGRGLYYSGRGRKPRFCDEHKTSSSKANGSSTGTKRGKVSDQELNDAVSNLSDLYDLIALPLGYLSPPAAQMWDLQVNGSEQHDLVGLNDRNRRNLANNKKLVQRINSRGEQGSTIAFALSQAFAIAPVLMIVYVGMTQSAAQKRAAQARVTQDQAPPPHFDHDADTVDLDQTVFHAPPPASGSDVPDLDDLAFKS